jgi:methylglutaconyl-CoA hydratase
LDETVISEITAALAELSKDECVRVVVIAGRGSSFCAGGDLNWMKRTAGFSEADNTSDAMRLAGMLKALHDLPKPTIARVHGYAFAGGMGLASACDIIVAEASAEFCLSEVKIGLVPATISPYVIRAMGAHAASRYMLTAERLSAVEAHRIGFVHELCEAGALDATVSRITAALRGSGPRALTVTKRLIAEVEGQTISSGLIDMTARLIAEVRASNEGREGVAAFLEKRKPIWSSPDPMTAAVDQRHRS